MVRRNTRLDQYNRVVKATNDMLDQYDGVTFTLRQMYYRLVATEVLENTINNYKNLSRWLVKAREDGIVDYRRFEDRARSTLGSADSSKDDPQEYLNGRIESVKNSWKYFEYLLWKNQDKYVEIWIEKDALSKIFSEVGDKYNVHTCPCKGYPSFSYVMTAVKRFWRVQEKYPERPIIIRYFGDFDPSGLDSPRNLMERFIEYGGFDEWSEEITLERVALTIPQINEYDLPPAPAKKSDVRTKKFIADTGTNQVVELDALEPPVLSKLVEDAIVELLDIDQWNKDIERSADARESLKDSLGVLDDLTVTLKTKKQRASEWFYENFPPDEEEEEEEE